MKNLTIKFSFEPDWSAIIVDVFEGGNLIESPAFEVNGEHSFKDALADAANYARDIISTLTTETGEAQ